MGQAVSIPFIYTPNTMYAGISANVPLHPISAMNTCDRGGKKKQYRISRVQELGEVQSAVVLAAAKHGSGEEISSRIETNPKVRSLDTALTCIGHIKFQRI